MTYLAAHAYCELLLSKMFGEGNLRIVVALEVLWTPQHHINTQCRFPTN